MASGPEGTESVNSKTWVLKVSIHCEGCKRKMKKILHKVKGVHAVEIDAKQDRVTVTGDVDPESLIQKLIKYGKHAELLPEKNHATAPAARTEPKANEKAATAAAAPAPETEEKKQAEKGKAVESPQIPPSAPAATSSDKVPAAKTDTDAPSQPEKINSENAATADADIKKKGKEVRIEESKVEEREVSDAVTFTGANSSLENSFPANSQPLYTTVSYHAVQPSTSYAYYAAPPPEMPSNYAFYGNPPPPAYPPPAGYPPEYYYSSESYYQSLDQPSQSTGSYDMFSDENPNACKLM